MKAGYRKSINSRHKKTGPPIQRGRPALASLSNYLVAIPKDNPSPELVLSVFCDLVSVVEAWSNS